MGRQLSVVGGQRSFGGRVFGALVMLALMAWVVRDPAGAASTAKRVGAVLWDVVGGLSKFASHLAS